MSTQCSLSRCVDTVLLSSRCVNTVLSSTCVDTLLLSPVVSTKCCSPPGVSTQCSLTSRCVDGSVMWRHLLGVVIQMCFSVAAAVAPVVTNCSPEGFIPEDVCLSGGSVVLQHTYVFQLYPKVCILIHIFINTE